MGFAEVVEPRGQERITEGRKGRPHGKGGNGGLTERAEECGWGYIHHPPTRSPYPLIRSPVRVALSRGMHPEAGASPAPSLHARLASRNPKYPGASCATTCPPRLRLRYAPSCVRHYYAFVVRQSQVDCALQLILRARVYLQHFNTPG